MMLNPYAPHTSEICFSEIYPLAKVFSRRKALLRRSSLSTVAPDATEASDEWRSNSLVLWRQGRAFRVREGLGNRVPLGNLVSRSLIAFAYEDPRGSVLETKRLST